MYLESWQIDSIERCYTEKYCDTLTAEEIAIKVEVEIESLENSNNYNRVKAFYEMSKSIPTKGMEKDMKVLNGIRKYFSYLNGAEYTPLERAKYRFNRFALECELKKNRSLIREYRPCTPRQQEVLLNMGCDKELVSILPMCRYSQVFEELKQDNQMIILFNEETLKKNQWLDPDSRDKEKNPPVEEQVLDLFNEEQTKYKDAIMQDFKNSIY